MPKPLLLLLLIFVGVVPTFAAGIQDTQPDPNLWTTSGDINIEAICYTNLKDEKVTEPEIGAVVRVYLVNRGKLPLMHLGSTQDSGFTLQGTDTNGNVIALRKPEREVSMTRVILTPGANKAYTIVIRKEHLDFLQKKPQFVEALIFDPSSKQATKVQAPIVFK